MFIPETKNKQKHFHKMKKNLTFVPPKISGM